MCYSLGVSQAKTNSMHGHVRDMISRQRAELTRSIDASIEEAQSEKRALLAATRAEARALDDQIKALRKERKRLQRVPRPRRDEIDNSTRSAGPAAIKAVEAFLAEHQIATQSAITEGTGKNSGTVTHALRVLESDKKVRWTGQRIRGSKQFEWTGKEIA